MWWWLLPPVKLILEERQTRKWRHDYYRLLIQEDRESLANFTLKAKGWIVVASAGLLAGVSSTWDLGGHLGWPGWARVALMVVLVYLSLFYTVSNLKRLHRISSPD